MKLKFVSSSRTNRIPSSAFNIRKKINVRKDIIMIYSLLMVIKSQNLSFAMRFKKISFIFRKNIYQKKISMHELKFTFLQCNSELCAG